MSQFNLNAPFDVGDTVYVATHILDQKLGHENVSMSLSCAKGKVVNIKRELDPWTGKPYTRVKIEFEGGTLCKISEEYWEDVIYTDEKECEQAAYVAKYGNGE